MKKFCAKNVDELYDRLKDLKNMSYDSIKEVKPSLENVINQIILHWIGVDANTKINDLINIYNKYIDCANDIYEIIHELSIPISNALSIKNYSLKLEDKIIAINKETNCNFNVYNPGEELYIEKESLIKDFKEINRIYEEMFKYNEQFLNCIEEMRNNWISGDKRDFLFSKIDIYKNNYSKLLLNFKEYKDNTTKVVANIESIEG